MSMEKNLNVDETMVLPINIQQVQPQFPGWIRVFWPVFEKSGIFKNPDPVNFNPTHSNVYFDISDI